MKTISIITHPLFIICSFVFILISGESFGGFYALYLLMALPYGSLYAILAVIGIALMVVNRVILHGKNKPIIESILNIISIGFLIASLVAFFYNDKSHYNSNTFLQAVPQITLLIFGLLTVVFLLYNVKTISQR